MGRRRDPHPTLEALRMRAVRERADCGIKRAWLEYDYGYLREKLVDGGYWTAEHFEDRERREEFVQWLLNEAMENICDPERIRKFQM